MQKLDEFIFQALIVLAIATVVAFCIEEGVFLEKEPQKTSQK